MGKSKQRVLVQETTLEEHATKRFSPLLLVPATESIICVALNQRTVLVATHYSDQTKRVTYCSKKGTCAECQRGWSAKAVAYLPVLLYPSKRQYLLVIPQSAYTYSPDLRAREGTLRGAVLTLCRLARSKRGPVKVAIDTRGVKAAELPQGWDALEDVAARWNLDVGGG